MADIVQCVNARCAAAPAFRFMPYGRRKVCIYACRRHTTLTLVRMFVEYGPPIMVYRMGGK